MRIFKTTFVFLAISLGLAASATAVEADWNDKGVAWQSYDAGLAQAKQQNKPICLVFFTTWCPHCHAYSRVFHDPNVVAKTKQFVMIRLDRDKNKELSKKFAPDGEYIPRTFFLTPQGALKAELTSGASEYKYFYNESDPQGILGGMTRALTAIK